jgi:hypothetical protein
MFFARMLGILSYQTLASLSNMLMMKIFGVMMLLHFLKDGDNARLVSTFGARDRPYFRCLGPGEKRAKGPMIKFANSSREGSILTEHATKELPPTGTSYQSVRRPSYFYVMRRSGAEPEPKCKSKVHEESPCEMSPRYAVQLDLQYEFDSKTSGCPKPLLKPIKLQV